MISRSLFIIMCAAAAAGAAPLYADGGAVRVHNGTSTTVTVNAESGYCCTADAGDICSCVLSLGAHKLVATRHDTNPTRTENVQVPADGYDFMLSDGSP